MEAVRFQGPEPRYVQLADELTRQIRAGSYAPHSRLPSESELMGAWNVSRVTVRQAMSLLEKRGLAVRRRGVGAFVTGPKVQYDLSMAGFYDTHVEQGLSPDVALLDFGAVTVEPAIAAKLRQPTALRIVRLYRVDGAPLALTYSYLRPEANRITRKQALDYPAYGILEKILGYTIDSAELTIRCETAGGGPADLLELSASDPVLVLGRTSFDAAHQPLESTVCYLRPEAYEFRITMRGAVPLVRNFRHAAATNERGTS